ncbi:MAG: NAD(P)-dependent alcohol dehydrogenase [Leptospirillum sp.]
MISTKGVATHGPKDALKPFSFERRDVGPDDVLIDIAYCGICHSDIHQARNEWGQSTYPMVPGHEIVGRVSQVGSSVRGFKVGDVAGVGCFVDSCGVCPSCREGEEQYCDQGPVWTYNSVEKDGKTKTYGGYSQKIVVKEKYCLRVSPDLPLSHVAPLLCAGITTYSPLRHFGVKAGDRVGVVGLGGLGHMGVKLASSMGAHVTVFSTSDKKAADAKRLGAESFVVTRDPKNFGPLANSLDFILDTVSAPHDMNAYLNLLRRDGQLVFVGVPEKPLEIHPFALIGKRRRMAASLIGGIRETQEMLDYCASKGITSDVEVIGVDRIGEAYDRTVKGDVRYRFVIDMKTL